ncbi:metalloprotease [Sungkyunkwania multivorans]|uniref:Metalloprotease n=1 Tax=Sungkyunkwania multivorans TaxID=1173618 RepID=A0ABW3CVY3_9FLAO
MKKRYKYILIIIFAWFQYAGYGQNHYTINAKLDVENKTLKIQQLMVFHNRSKDTLNQLYLNDWAYAYANRDTPLAKRFAEEFNRGLHLTKDKDRGNTDLIAISDNNYDYIEWSRLKRQSDIVKLQLNYPVYPGQKYALNVSYEVQLPSDRFTRYGVDDQGNYSLRYWYLSFPVYKEGDWKLHSNKDLDDMYMLGSDYKINLEYPSNLSLVTELETISKSELDGKKFTTLIGYKRTDIKLFLKKNNDFVEYETDKFSLITNMDDKKLSALSKSLIVDRISYFMDERLGSFPHQKLLVSEIDYRKNPVYGLNQLPSFFRPFPDDFQFEITLLKAVTNNYLEKTMLLDPREEQWVTNALQTYLMMEYIEEFYPDMKLAGNLSNFWGIRRYEFAKMQFNEQYPFFFMMMARKNLDQPLSSPLDSLIRFNEKIANKYKAGVGFKYLESYLNADIIKNSVKNFYNEYKLKDISQQDFEKELRAASPKDISWFFDDFVSTRSKVDYKIKKVKKFGDSLKVTIKNKTKKNFPVTLFSLQKDSVISKIWLEGIQDQKTITIPSNDADKLVLNYDKVIPEFNQRDNWKSVNGFTFYNRPFQFRFFKDAENPHYNQIFFVPIATFNVYDGFTPGLRFYNKAIINKPFVYDIKPSWAFKEKALVGSGSISLTDNFEDDGLYFARYSLGGATFHFAPNSRYISITPAVSFGFRTKDFRSNKRNLFTLRHVIIQRSRDDGTPVDTEPDYSVFNARYTISNPGAINFFSWRNDLQISNNFSKFSAEIEYRKLFRNNRQFNLRLFAGKFIYNDTESTDFFSFGLSRPNDYLFDYSFLGRSEDDGLVSQQFILGEGGFKSKLDDRFSNDLMLTANTSYSIWRYIEAYADFGVIKNDGEPFKALYDSGIRLNLVEDYFELYFPLYSSRGWEPGLPNYGEQIRFTVTLSPKTLINLFTRKWF